MVIYEKVFISNGGHSYLSGVAGTCKHCHIRNISQDIDLSTYLPLFNPIPIKFCLLIIYGCWAATDVIIQVIPLQVIITVLVFND